MCRKGCNGSEVKPKLIFKLSAADLFTQVDTTHLRVACYSSIRAKQLERCVIKIKIKNYQCFKKWRGCFQKYGCRLCRIRCKGTEMGLKWILGGGGMVGSRLGEIDKGSGHWSLKIFQAVPVTLALSPLDNYCGWPQQVPGNLSQMLLYTGRSCYHFFVPVLAQIWPTEVQYLAVSLLTQADLVFQTLLQTWH